MFRVNSSRNIDFKSSNYVNYTPLLTECSRSRWACAFVCLLGASAPLLQAFNGMSLGNTIKTEDCNALYVHLYKIIRPLAPERRKEVLEVLRVWAGCNSGGRQANRPMTVAELKKLQDGDLVGLGAHTMSHPVLSRLPIDRQRSEIGQSKALLEDIAGHRITSFAYPFGEAQDYTAEAVEAVREAGFECAFAASPGLIEKRSEPFKLPRNFVGNWDGDVFARRLRQSLFE